MRSRLRIASLVLLALILTICCFPRLLTSDPSDEQYRNEIDLPPSRRFPLGTDDLGRNRLARLLSGTKMSLMLAPLAALVSVSLACAIGVAAATTGRSAGRVFEFGADLIGSLPWLFVLIALRASLPLDSPPEMTTMITFAVLALLGWSGPARVIRNVAAGLSGKEFILQAEALGVSRFRIATIHVLPNVWRVAVAQLLLNIPIFILAEANLGLLGMGVSEPIASLGNQLKELSNIGAVPEKPWLLAPAITVMVISGLLWTVSTPEERT